MKKLLLLSVVLFVLAGCSKDDTTSPGTADQNAAFVPHIYGVAMLESPAPATRGVANALKVWSKPMAADNLTVKFLNGTERYKEYVMEVAKEWEKAAGVRFHFVGSDKAAVIRVGFDYVPGMMSSWALTGTDHMQVYGQQTETTVHFAQWRRASDAQKRSDVLRAFGQVLGLELEFRHPNFHPAWITNADGTVNEAAIKEYWENELADCITWAELKKIVLEPLSNQAFFISKTEHYDQASVMNWPFYEMIAHNIRPIEFDEDYKSELSVNDKTFAQSLYGKSFEGDVGPERFFPLIEFEFTGSSTNFSVTTTKNLGVKWDDSVSTEFTAYDLPTDTTTLHKFEISQTFSETKTRKIVIGEVLDYGQTKPDYSYALTKFDFTGANYAKAIDIKPLNHALSYIRIIGGQNFTNQVFEFNGYQFIKELYLVQILDSKVFVDNCQNLEVLATSRFIHKPTKVSGSLVSTPMGSPVDGVYPGVEGPIVEWPIKPITGWSLSPELNHSISDLSRSGLTILNCDKLREISLENTRIKNISFGNLPNLEYVYLSSVSTYIVGGSSRFNNSGEYLSKAFATLVGRKGLKSGQIVLRGISFKKPSIIPIYAPVSIFIGELNTINSITRDKNWTVIWDSGCKPYLKNPPLDPPIIIEPIDPPIDPPIHPIYPPIKLPFEDPEPGLKQP